MFTLLISVVLAYLLGSVCTAILVCKSLGLEDPRTQGSQNPGVTNVLRIGGKKAAILTLAGDIAKGIIPILLARLLNLQGFSLSLVAFATLIGHAFPFFFSFKGGKGIATSFGAVLALSPTAGFLSAIIWVAVAVFTRYSSLASLVTASIAPLLILWKLGIGAFVPLFAMSALLFWRHKANIHRLRAGNETKIKL